MSVDPAALAYEAVTRGGFSVDAYGDAPLGGFMVALPDTELRLPVSILSDVDAFGRALTAWLRSHAELLSHPNRYIGGWVDRGQTLVLDVSERIGSRWEAIRIGRERNQDSIYDVALDVCVYLPAVQYPPDPCDWSAYWSYVHDTPARYRLAS